MAKRPDITDITTSLSARTVLNNNFQEIEEAFDNTLSRDGSTPNQMEGDLDLNGNDLLNVRTVASEELTVNGQQVVDASFVPDWKGAWATSTAYVINDIVREDGNVYICLVAHTSGTFSTDLGSSKWELFASKGSAGAGTGDLLSTNNLSDIADAASARTNLGLSIGGTVQGYDATLDTIATQNGVDTPEIEDGAVTLVKLDSSVYGTSGNDKLLQLESDGKLPTLDASNLTNLPVVGLIDYQEFTANGTWTKPTVQSGDRVTIEIVGGGGGGVRDTGGTGNAGSGGSGGSGLRIEGIDVDQLDATVNVIVGSGGNGEIADTSTPAEDGGDSEFQDSTWNIVAPGGTAGRDNNNDSDALTLVTIDGVDIADTLGGRGLAQTAGAGSKYGGPSGGGFAENSSTNLKGGYSLLWGSKGGQGYGNNQTITDTVHGVGPGAGGGSVDGSNDNDPGNGADGRVRIYIQRFS